MGETKQQRADQAALRTNCLLVLTVLAGGAALYLLKPVLVPFVLAVFLTYCLSPVIDFGQRRLGLGHGPAIAGAVLLGVVILVAAVFVLVTSVGKIADNIDHYQKRFNELMDNLSESLPLEELGIRADAKTGWSLTLPAATGRRVVTAVVGEVASVASEGALVLIFLIFLLMGRKGARGHPVALLVEVEDRVKQYLLKILFLCALTGLLVGLTLAVLGVEFAALFGLLTFLFNFIPTVGSIIASLVTLPVILLSPDLSVPVQVLAIAVPAAVQFIVGNFIQPRMTGVALDLHPVTVLMALLFFGMIWGITGAFLAAPIAAVIRIVLEKIPATRPLAALMAGDLDALSRPGETQPKAEDV